MEIKRIVFSRVLPSLITLMTVIGVTSSVHATAMGFTEASATLSWSVAPTLTIWEAQYEGVRPYGSTLGIDTYIERDSGWKLDPDTMVSATRTTPIGPSYVTASTANNYFSAEAITLGPMPNLVDFNTSANAQSYLRQHESTICATSGYGEFTLTLDYDLEVLLNIDPSEYDHVSGQASAIAYLELYGSQFIGDEWVLYDKYESDRIVQSIISEDGLPASFSESRDGTLSVTMDFVNTWPKVKLINVRAGTIVSNNFYGVVPEPSMMLLAGTGLVVIVGSRFRRKKM